MLVILGTIRIPPGRMADARLAMTAMIEASRAEDGCLEYAYAVDVLDPGLVHVNEAWRDRTALDRYFQSPHILAWRAAWPALGIFDRKLRLCEVEAWDTT